MNIDVIETYPKSINDLFGLLNRKIDISEMLFYFKVKNETNDSSSEYDELSAKLKFLSFSNTFVLVKKGWLPLHLAQPQNFFLDRNIISRIKTMQGKSKENRCKLEYQELNFLNSNEVTLNVLLHAIEADYQRNPTFQEFCDSVTDSRIAIKNIFPNVNVFDFNDEYLKIAYDFVFNDGVKFSNLMNFFMEISNFLLSKCSVGAEQKVLDNLIRSAEKNSISLKSLSFYAAISCLYEDIHGDIFSIGRKLIKPKMQFTIKDAYNVAADIRHIELTSVFQVLDEPRVVNFITKDMALAALWVSTNPLVTISENNYNIKYEVHNLLLPRLSEECFKELISSFGR